MSRVVAMPEPDRLRFISLEKLQGQPTLGEFGCDLWRLD